MNKRKLNLVRPTAEEEAEIAAQLAEDPDTYEWTEEDWANVQTTQERFHRFHLLVVGETYAPKRVACTEHNTSEEARRAPRRGWRRQDPGTLLLPNRYQVQLAIRMKDAGATRRCRYRP